MNKKNEAKIKKSEDFTLKMEFRTFVDRQIDRREKQTAQNKKRMARRLGEYVPREYNFDKGPRN